MPRTKNPRIVCEICNIEMMRKDYVRHIASKDHKANMRKIYAKPKASNTE